MNDKLLIQPGKWFAEFDEESECISVIYDDSYRQLLGYESETEYADGNDTWVNSLHPDDRERVEQHFAECTAQRLDNKDYDIEYRMMTKWGYRWFHDYGHCYRRMDGTVSRMDGIVFDIQDIVERNEEHHQLYENYARFFALEDDFESLYDVELETGLYVSYDRDEFYRSAISDRLVSSTKFFEGMRTNIERVIYEEDRQALFDFENKEAIIRGLANNDHIDHYYRIKTGNGPMWLKMRIVYKDATKKNVIFGIFNAEEEMAARQKEEQAKEELRITNSRLFALEDNFESMYDVELDSGRYEVFVKGDFFRDKVIDKLSKPGDYFAELRGNIDAVIYPEDKAGLLSALQRDSIRRELSIREHYDYYYRMFTDDGTMWFKMRLVYKDADRKNVIIGVFNAAAEMAAKEKEEKERWELIDQMAGDEAVMLVDCVTDGRSIIHDSIHRLDEFSDFTGYSRNFAKYIENYVDPSDRDMMRTVSAPAYMLERASKEKEYKIRYKDISAKEPHYYEMRVVAFSETSVLQSFREVDELVSTELAQNAIAKDYFAIYLADLKNDVIKVVKRSPSFRETSNKMQGCYSKIIVEYVKGLDEKEREKWDGLDTLEGVKRFLHDQDKRELLYESAYRGNKLARATWYVVERVQGEPEIVCLAFADLDEEQVTREKLHEQIVAQQEQLQEALSMAQSANRAKTDFLFSMSHDIRTPMNAIIGFTNLAIKHIEEKEKVLDCLEKTQRSGGMLLSLINSVLEVSRIEAGHAVVEEKYGDVYHSFTNIDNTMRELADTKDIKLSFEFGDIRDRYIHADFGRCMRIFLNVISNAIKYTPAGGTVKVRCEQIRGVVDGYALYRYTVSDNGIGMSEEFQKHVFDQFSRENTATVSGVQGSGLGMSVVKSFVDLMGGTVTVKSQAGVGTDVTIVLPFRIQNEEANVDPVTGEIIAGTTDTELAETIEFKGKKILLVEDNELNREIVIELLNEEGLIVEEADDGTMAVEIMKQKGPEFFSAILMDIQMPVMNGYEATRYIRKMYPVHRIPIIALSANAFAEDKAAAIDAGMDDHVAKPINVKELFEVLAKYV